MITHPRSVLLSIAALSLALAAVLVLRLDDRTAPAGSAFEPTGVRAGDGHAMRSTPSAQDASRSAAPEAGHRRWLATAEPAETGVAAPAPEPTAVALRGRVVDQTGDPVPGAALTFTVSAGARHRGAAATATSGLDGDWAGSMRLAEGDLLTVTARHPQHGLALLRHHRNGSAATLHLPDLVVTAGGLASGRVVGRGGAPLAGATVRAETSLGPAGSMDGTAGHALETTTDASGRFALAGIPRGVFRIVAVAASHLPGRSDALKMAPSTVVECGRIALSPGLPLTGVVVDDHGKPVAGASIEVTTSHHDTLARAASAHDPSHAPGTRSDRSTALGTVVALTDAEGNFRFDGLPHGTLRLDANHAEHSPATIDPVRLPHPSGLRIALTARQPLTGTVVDAHTGAPIESFGLHARRAATIDANAVPRSLPAPRRREAGRFTAKGLAAGPHVLDVNAPGYIPLAFGPVEVRPGMHPRPITVALQRGAVLRGRVVNRHSGTPISHARLDVYQPRPSDRPGQRDFRRGFIEDDALDHRGARIARTHTDRNGHFELSTAHAGRCTIVVTADGYASSVDDNVLLALAAEQERDFDLETDAIGRARDATNNAATGAIIGRVRIGGTSPDGIEVSVHDPRRAPYPVRAVPDADGNFHLGPLALGEYTLTVGTPRGVLHTESIEVRSGPPLQKELELHNDSLELRIDDDDGTPIAHGVLLLIDASTADGVPASEWDGLSGCHRALIQDGTVALQSIRAGRYCYTVRGDGAVPSTGFITVADTANRRPARITVAVRRD